MIIWTGKGALAWLILVGAFGLLAMSGDLEDNAAFTYALLIASPITFMIGRVLNSPKLGIDEDTGTEFTYQPNHSMFWIPLQYWGVIFLIIGLIALASA